MLHKENVNLQRKLKAEHILDPSRKLLWPDPKRFSEVAFAAESSCVSRISRKKQ